MFRPDNLRLIQNRSAVAAGLAAVCFFDENWGLDLINSKKQLFL